MKYALQSLVQIAAMAVMYFGLVLMMDDRLFMLVLGPA